MRQILAIVFKDFYVTFTDRNTLLIMLVTPALIASIIGFAFGGGSSGQITLSNIPIALVNLDEGATVNADELNYGATITGILAPANGDEAAVTGANTCDAVAVVTDDNENQQSLASLFAVAQYDTPEQARAGVEAGDYAAAIIIPADYTAKMVPFDAEDESDSTASTSFIEVYASPASPIFAGVTQSVTSAIHQQFLTGSATIRATINTLIQRAQERPLFGLMFSLMSSTGAFAPDFNCAFTSAYHTVSLETAALGTNTVETPFVVILVSSGAAQAMFFALFSANAVLLSMYTERKQWTLQRLIMVPMPRAYILIGKLASVLLIVGAQIVILLGVLTLIASIATGQLLFIWGDYPVLLLALILAVTLAVGGIGTLVVGLAANAEQANVVGSMLFAGLAAIGGAFGFAVPETVAQFSPIYWGTRGFTLLSLNQPDIGLHIAVLGVMGLVTFTVGAMLFARRSDFR